MQVRLTIDSPGKDAIIPAGTVIDDACADLLCQLGVAEPVDEEAIEAYEDWRADQAARTQKQKDLQQLLRRTQRAEAKKAQAKLKAEKQAAFEAQLKS